MNSLELKNYLYNYPPPNEQSFILGMIAVEDPKFFKLKQIYVEQNIPNLARSISKIFVYYEKGYWKKHNKLNFRECETFLKISLQMSRTGGGDFKTREFDISISDFYQKYFLHLKSNQLSDSEQWIEHFTSTFLKKTLLNQTPETSKQNVKIKI